MASRLSQPLPQMELIETLRRNMDLRLQSALLMHPALTVVQLQQQAQR